MKNISNPDRSDFQLKSDKELFGLMKDGVRPAYEELTERWGVKLYNKAYRRIQNNSIAANLIEEVFFDLWDNRRILKIKNVSDHLKGSLKHKLHILYEQKELPSSFAEPLNHFAMAILNADSALSIQEIKDLIEKWLLIQPSERVQIFNLKYKVKLTSKEISEKIGIPLKAVNKQIKTSGLSLNEYVQRFLIRTFNRKNHRIRRLLRRRKPSQ